MTPERLAELRARASRPRRTVPVVLNGELAEQIANVQDELADLDRAPRTDRRLASKSTTAKAAELEAKLDALYADAEADTLLVVVEGMQGTAFDTLLALHPPKPGEDGKPREGFDALCDKAAILEPLIRAAVIGQRTTVDSEDVEPLPEGTLDWLLDFCTAEQRDSLFVAAWFCSRKGDAVPLRRRRSTAPTSDAE